MAVKTYSYKKDKNKYISPHTQVKEMASKKGNKIYSDVVLVDEKLMEMIEKLFSYLNCKKYVISSGYRTAEHDKVVGGNGIGQHTKGRAVDACFYDKNGKIIPAQIVCCAAQDLGFSGIANISKAYKYVHLDVRGGAGYKGDEIKGTNTVTKDFYAYFGLTKTDVAKYTGQGVSRYPKYCGNSGSIVTALKSIGVNSSFAHRAKIAKVNGISGYIGTAAQNTKMLSMLKQGALVRV